MILLKLVYGAEDHAFYEWVLQANNIKDRTVWVADSFEGLPAPNLEQYPKDYGDYLHIRLLTSFFRNSARKL